MPSTPLLLFLEGMTAATIGGVVVVTCAVGLVWYGRWGKGFRARLQEARIRQEMAEGRYGNAVPWLLDHGRYREAAEVEEKRGNSEQAAKLFERAGDLQAAAQVYVRAGDHEMAALVFKSAGLMAQAADAFARAGRHDAAAAALEEAGVFDKAASHWKQHGDVQRASAMFQRAGQDGEARKILAEAAGRRDLQGLEREPPGEPERPPAPQRPAGQGLQAARVLEAQGRVDEAAELYMAEGDFASAAGLYQRKGKHRDAARAWFRAGDMHKAIALLEVVKDHLAMARVYLAWGKGAEARSALAAVGSDGPAYKDALVLLAELELKEKRPQDAYRAYDRLVRWAADRRSVGPETRQWLVQMAEILFSHGKRVEGIACLQRVGELGLMTPELAEKLRELEGLGSAPPAGKKDAIRKLTTTLGVPRHERYEFQTKIGQGGNGVIYKAHDRMLGRNLVIKMILQTAVADDVAKRFFLREAQTAAQLNHPNIVTIYDMGEMSGQPFIAMELVEGQNLADICEQDGALPVPPKELLHITSQLCAAMQYAHDRGFVHRDIKLENIMLTAGKDVKLMDFGLAKAFTSSDKTMVISGTPVYMSPEQITGHGIDHRTDIYALGVMLFLLETGAFPFEDGNIFYHHQETPPPDPRTFNPALPPGFKDVIDRCMAKRKEDRFAGCMDVHRALVEVFG